MCVCVCVCVCVREREREREREYENEGLYVYHMPAVTGRKKRVSDALEVEGTVCHYAGAGN